MRIFVFISRYTKKVTVKIIKTIFTVTFLSIFKYDTENNAHS